MKNKKNFWAAILTLPICLVFLAGCVDEKPTTNKKKPVREVRQPVNVPIFDADSAYQYVEDQVAFGPRVPNTPEHEACAVYLEKQLKSFGADVIVQEGEVTAFDGTKLGMKNIIGQFQPEKSQRVLLFAHWDTRPFADKDDDKSRQNVPIDGANDGGSGVGVLLEVARILQKKPTSVGVDIIFFDTEDYGPPQFGPSGDGEDWCLGSQYWANNPHVENYTAKFGILLDMVGGKNAKFPKEGTSMYFAPHIVSKVWQTAGTLGYGDYFVDKKSNMTTDDHLFVNQLRNIPSAAIVEFHVEGMGYGMFHHTHLDNMDVIDKTALKATGQTVLDVVYREL